MSKKDYEELHLKYVQTKMENIDLRKALIEQRKEIDKYIGLLNEYIKQELENWHITVIGEEAKYIKKTHEYNNSLPDEVTQKTLGYPDYIAEQKEICLQFKLPQKIAFKLIQYSKYDTGFKENKLVLKEDDQDYLDLKGKIETVKEKL